MNTKKRQRPEEGSVFLVLELIHTSHGPLAGVHCLASLPGRDDVAVRSWKSPQGIIDSAQLEDMATTIAKEVVDATCTWLGVQQTWAG